MRGPARKIPSRPSAAVYDSTDSRAPHRPIGRGFRLLFLAVATIGATQVAPAAQSGITLLQPVPTSLPKAGNLRLPPPPAWVPHPAALWSVEDFTRVINRDAERPAQVSYTRVNFVRPDHRWLVAFDQWFRTLTKSLKIGFVEETWDCDNYARCFVAFADLVALQGGETRDRSALAGPPSTTADRSPGFRPAAAMRSSSSAPARGFSSSNRKTARSHRWRSIPTGANS